jgi:hypothetical protein
MATLTLGAPRTWQCRVSARDCPADHILTAGFPPPPRSQKPAPRPKGPLSFWLFGDSCG